MHTDNEILQQEQYELTSLPEKAFVRHAAVYITTIDQ